MYINPLLRFSATAPSQPPYKLPSKAKTVSLLGAKQDTIYTHPYFLALQAIASKLSSRGYAIITGASTGANYYGSLGASPENSFAIHVKGVPPIQNIRPISNSPLYQDYATVDSYPARTKKLGQLCDTLIVAPGGLGSLEEVTSTLVNMYYKTPGAPTKLILLGKDYWAPLQEMFQTMIKAGTAGPHLSQYITILDAPMDKPDILAEQVVKLIQQDSLPSKTAEASLKSNASEKKSGTAG
ncbi:MAG: LOG family protein [Vampirovibrio sp.]|nr:LOG family protein [Vampirovibrio sp.]